ncbi:MAG: 3-isopropylmalate dehydrogenase [Planctomycetota bacterium]
MSSTPNGPSLHVAALGGDGVGPEVVAGAVVVLEATAQRFGIRLKVDHALVGGAAIDACGKPLPDETLALAKVADAVLLGAVGDARFEHKPHAERAEAGLGGLRRGLELWSNLRPIQARSILASTTPFRPEVIEGVDMLIVRELSGGIYVGGPRGREGDQGQRTAHDTMRYDEHQIARIARVGFEAARKRRGTLISVDKANVLQCSVLWREVVNEVAREFTDVKLEHHLVDSFAMRIITHPREIDVVVTSNLFGDILSDEASVIAGGLGLLPSASLGGSTGLYEPVHGTAPDIAGQGKANPIATILSAAMLLRHTARLEDAARAMEAAVDEVLHDGIGTPDLRHSRKTVGTMELAEVIAQRVLAGATADRG